jgi:membrane protease YdiL (CAAX protease family)
MNALKTYQRLFFFLLLVLLVTCLLSPWMAVGADWFVNTIGQRAERYSFSRIFNRTYMIAGIVLFVALRGFLRIGSMSRLGLPPLGRGAGDLITGWLLAIGSMIALGAVMSLAGVFTPYFRLSLSDSLSRCAGALATGLTVGFLEEIFFRGIFLKGLIEDLKPAAAFILANLFYAAVHFVKPGEPYYADVFDPWLGFRHLASTFAPFANPLELGPGLAGLFLIGLALSYAFVRTNSLYLSIGIHAGWIFSIKTIRVFGDYMREDLGWLFGSTDPKIVSGPATWAGILVVIAAVHWITRNRTRLSATETAVHGEIVAKTVSVSTSGG